MTTVPCPHCGADILSDAISCRHCGSSDSDGWGKQWYDEEGEGEGDDDFDYDSFVRDNFSGSSISTSTAPLWKYVAVLLLVVFVLGMLALV